MKKRMWAVLLAVVLVISMVGCASGEKGNTEEAVKETTSETPEAETEKDAEPVSLLPYTGEEITFTFFWFDAGADYTDETLPMVQALQEKLGNVKLELEVLPLTDYTTKLPLLMAGGELPDIMIINNAYDYLNTYAQNGIFLDWAPLMEAYMPNVSRYAEELNAYGTLKDSEGHQYAIPSGITSDDIMAMNWLCNRTLLDSLGIKVPETRDEFLEACRKVKAETGIIPIQMDGDIGALMTNVAQMFKNQGDWWTNYYPEEGKWDFGPTREDSELKDLMTFINILWDEELIDHEINTQTREQVLDYIYGGQFAFTYDYQNQYAHDQYDSVKAFKDSYDFSIEVMPTPKGTGAWQKISTPKDGNVNWAIVSNAKTEHPELLAACIDLMFSDEVREMANFGIKGESYELDADGKPYYTDKMKLASTYYAGETTMDDMGYQRSPWLRAMGVTDAEAYYQTWESPEILAGREKVIEMLDAGELKAAYNYSRPTLTEEESNEVANISNPVETYLWECLCKFMMGDMDVETQWDEFMEKLVGYGDMDVVCEILNSKEMPVFKGNWR